MASIFINKARAATTSGISRKSFRKLILSFAAILPVLTSVLYRKPPASITERWLHLSDATSSKRVDEDPNGGPER